MDKEKLKKLLQMVQMQGAAAEPGGAPTIVQPKQTGPSTSVQGVNIDTLRSLPTELNTINPLARPLPGRQEEQVPAQTPQGSLVMPGDANFNTKASQDPQEIARRRALARLGGNNTEY